MRLHPILILFLLLIPPIPIPDAAAQEAASTPILPPLIPWTLKDPSLVLPADDPWATDFEKSGLEATPRYAETAAWLKKLVAAAPELEMISLGTSDEGRAIWMVIASKEQAFTPKKMRATGKPTLLAQGGIHSGEIDGKDAGMMLLRDLTVRGTKKKLLDGANFLFIPILSVDGHERFSRFSRVNQRGPVESGWRTNARNLNLNRDYAKLDTAGVRAAVKALVEWDPELYYDIHVTDGADYQYDITWGHNGAHAHSPRANRWLAVELDSRLRVDLKAAGHIPGPLVFAVDGRDMTKGNRAPTFGPRYSHGYGDLRHSPSILVENHSLKPYNQRVLGTYVLLASTLKALGETGTRLREEIEKDRADRRKEVPLSFQVPEGEPPVVDFLGIEQKIELSDVSGGLWVKWLGKPVALKIPEPMATQPDLVAVRPRAYWVPAAWPEVIERLRLHGIKMETLDAPRTLEVEMTRLVDPKLAGAPFEGRMRIRETEYATELRKETMAPGCARVPTDQPLGALIVALLDPRGPDSFLHWGFFLEIFQRTEYIEGYVLEPMARKMLEEDAALSKEFRQKLMDDEEFRKDPRARLRWFYERTPFHDDRWLLYPVAREP